MKKLLFAALPLLLIACKNNDSKGNGEDNGEKTEAPKSFSYSVLNTYPHDTSSYTQGLIVYKGEMYEGTGLETRSKLMKVDLKTGKSLQSIKLDDKYFGEGITILHDTLYQLTWQNKVVFMYSLKDFKKLGEFPLGTDGWGITNDGKELIVSDGTSNLNFYEPSTFKYIRTVNITESGGLANNVNELEYIDGYVYANKYQTNYILKIDPQTGIVVAKADLSKLSDTIKAKYPFTDVLNGIAYDATTKKIYITGKLWPELYEVQFSN
ncbi:MAG TPA: glutaminyl-peptide cyclotransferase [Chitinophagaceae bacterium]